MFGGEEEALIDLILNKRSDLSRQDIEKIIKEKMMMKNVSRKTALYLLSIDLGIRLERPVEDYIKISQLTDGLSNIRVIGRILWLKDTEKLRQREGKYTRGGLIDDSGLANIIFWDRSREDLEKDGVVEGALVEILNGYVRNALSGKPEIHLTRRGTIKGIYEEKKSIPSIRDILKPVNEVSVGDDYVNVYGVILSVDKEREVVVGEKKVKVNSFVLGSEDKTVRVVLWRDAVEEYRWIKEGDKILIYNGRIKLNKFNEIEIHISRNSHIKIYPGIDINIKTKIITLSQVDTGYNMNKLYLRVLAKGLRKINVKDGKETLTLYVIDNTGDASLTLMGKALKIGNMIKIQDSISIEMFRASLKAGNLFLFAGDSSKMEINPHDLPIALPIYSIPFKTAKKITTMDKIISIEGRIIEFLEAENVESIFPIPSFFLIEDSDENPVKVSFRGDLKTYSETDLREGDEIRILGALVDISSLINAPGIPVIKLRAFTRIEKIRY